MKSKGSVLEFTEMRNKELMRAYREALAECTHISVADVSERIVNKPCSRFWVSEERALVVVSAVLRGVPVMSLMRSTKKEMYAEIINRVKAARARWPSLSLADIVMKVVHTPAPKFYMRPRCAMEIIYKIKNEQRGKRIRAHYAETMQE